jgi:hypothetical protein
MVIFMPIHKIEVLEYECVFCGYKWINRINGKDGLIPQRCAKCKKFYWNDGQHIGRKSDPITPQERGLRIRLCKFEGYDPRKDTGFGGSTSYKPNDLCKNFLNANPRPTIDELVQALQPLGWDIRKHEGYIKDPEKAAYLKYDPIEYEKLLKQETQKRREYMQQIIKSRSANAGNIKKEVLHYHENQDTR